MKKLLVVLAVMLGFAGLLFVIGCSDDDDESTNPVVKETGDPNDPEFETAGVAFGMVDDMNNTMFEFMFFTLDTVANEFPQMASWKAPAATGPALPASDSVYLTYHNDSQYWYLFLQVIDTTFIDTTEQIYTAVIEDSIRFKHGTEIVQYPDSALLTGVDRGIALMMSLGEQSVQCHQQFSLTGDLPGYGDVTINGNSSFNFSIEDSIDMQYCTFDMSLTGLYNDIYMNLAAMDTGGCPTSGTASYNGNIAANCQGDTTISFNEQWSVVQTFDNGVIHYVVENSTTRWEFDETCGGGVVTAPRNPFGPFLSRMQ